MKLTMQDQKRVEILQHILAGQIGILEASQLLDRTERSVYRMLSNMRQKGLSGIIHGNRGKASPKRLCKEVSEQILSLVSSKYGNVNDTHLSELLWQREQIRISRESLRSLLRKSGIGPKRGRRKGRVYRRRERKEAMGMMLQLDGSSHDWLEGRAPWMTLVGAKDDATGYVWARFVKSESTWSYFELMEDIFRSHGLPLSLYSDRHSIFHVLREQTIQEQLKDIKPLSQFGRAMEAFGIQIIKAWTPQAKGRIERQWGVFQDRLIVEMRLAGIDSMEAANHFLEEFLMQYNQRFCVEPKKTNSVFREAPNLETCNTTLCIRDTRVVNKDHTISFEGLVLQIPPVKNFHSLAKKRVDVLQLKQGHIEIQYNGTLLARFSQQAVERLANKSLTSKTNLKLQNLF